MDRASEHKAVCRLRLPDKLDDRTAEDAFAFLAAAAAADAAADGRRADPENFRLHAAGFERLCDLLQGSVGAAVFVRAAVDE